MDIDVTWGPNNDPGFDPADLEGRSTMIVNGSGLRIEGHENRNGTNKEKYIPTFI